MWRTVASQQKTKIWSHKLAHFVHLRRDLYKAVEHAEDTQPGDLGTTSRYYLVATS